MNQNELLKSSETLSTQENKPETVKEELSKAEVETIYTQRQKLLEKARGIISLKFYYEISDKLENEKKQFEKLLNWQTSRDEALSHYSFVLNPYYFEQKFL
jgi:hypothetical protein